MDAQDHLGYTAIEVAAAYGQAEVVRLLLEHEYCMHWHLRRDVYERAIVLGASNSEVVCFLAEKADVQESQEIIPTLDDALQNAIQHGSNEDVRSLLQTEACRDICVNPAAVVAIKEGFTTKLEMILDYGADPSGCSRLPNVLHNHSCRVSDLLLIALDVRFLHDQIVDLLCGRGATIGLSSSSWDFTRIPLGLLNSNRLAYARLLLDKGPDVPLETVQLAWRGPVNQQPFNLVEILLYRGVVPLSGTNDIGDDDSYVILVSVLSFVLSSLN